jgi:hypothetical protein
MTPNQDGTWTYHVLHRFASYPTDGQMPGGGLAMDKSGNFYGTTLGGCSARERFSSSASPAAVGRKPWSYDFPNCTDGCGPVTTPIFDKAGNLYW